MTRYVERPASRRPAQCQAARYEPGKPLDDLLAVARRKDPDALVAEVPELQCLVVRYLDVPDHHPASVDFDVVEAGDMLVYSQTHDLLYDTDPESFEREWTPTS